MPGRMVNPVAAMVAEIAVIDAELGDELRRATRRIITLVRLLEPVLRHFAQLELRLERIIAQIEDASGQEVSDELRDRVAGRLGILRVRPALERLGRAHPDVLDKSSADVPA
jgi:DNA-binding transcriptional LysR family regulator